MGLSDLDMQKIARETNFSETAFILSDKKANDGYNVRIFTPQRELPFAGHPTLGTAYVIGHKIIQELPTKTFLNLKVGQIPVEFDYTINEQEPLLWMKQIAPTFGECFDKKMIAERLSLDVEEIDCDFPVEEISTGLPFVIVPIRNLVSMKRAKISKEQIINSSNMLPDKAFLLFCPETYNEENDLNVRVFAHEYGIPEDPATGSANGCLAGYLLKNQYFGKDKVDLRIEQGNEIGRPSLLLIKARQTNGQIDICVGGKVMMVAEGKLV